MTLDRFFPDNPLAAIWRAVWLVLHDYYPPRLYVFLPVYKILRRRLRIPMVASNLLVWVVSALLHGGVLLCGGHVVGAVVIGAIFLGLGLLSTLAVLVTKRSARQCM